MAALTDISPVITIEGLNLDDYSIMDVHLSKELLKPASLQFSMRKKQLRRNQDDITFSLAGKLLGAKVEFKVKTSRLDEKQKQCGEELSFSGIIFGAQTQRERMGQSNSIRVTAYSPDHLLLDSPHCFSFENKTLSEIVAESVKPYNGTIKTNINPQMTEAIPYVVQYNETTYEFLSRLAQRYGEYLFFENGKFYFGECPAGKEIKLYPDTDLLGFRYGLEMAHTEFSHAQHDYLKYENSVEKGYDNSVKSLHGLADITFKKSHYSYKKQTLRNVHCATQEDAPLQQVKSSSMSEGLGRKAHMMVCHLITHRADIQIGDKLTLQEYIDNGQSRLTNHEKLMVIALRCSATIDGHFENEITAILADAPFAPYWKSDLYPMCESQRAVVVDNKDPQHLGRVRVQFLWQELQDKKNMFTPWLRITQPHGGDDKGFYFIPEIGEEVMVAFENGNAEKPYVVGTLYHGQQHPGKPWPDRNNNVKAIRTRNGHTVEIHDEGQGGYIRIYDYQKENYILTYSTDEKLIKLESTGNIELYAKNDIIMHAGHDINVSADHDISESADNDFFMSAGNDMQRTANNDIHEHAGNDRSANIDHNDSLNVSENQFIEIGDNKDEQVAHKVQLTAENIRVEATDQLLEYSKTHHMKADDEMALNANSKINIKAGMVKVN